MSISQRRVNATPSFAATDVGNAERFALDHGAHARFCSQWNAWLIWDGTRWARDTSGAVTRMAIQTVRKIPDEAQRSTDESQRRELLKWALKSESHPRIQAMISLAEKQDGIAVSPCDLDSDPWLFNVPNGTVNLKTGRLQDHDTANLITRIAGSSFDEEAQCPDFLKFLNSTFSGDKDVISYIQRMAGYSLVGITREQVMLFQYGRGSNGKSKLNDALLAMFGEYGQTMDPATITLKHGDKMATGLAELFGKRFVTCSETREGMRLDEALVKRMTGGEEIIAERKYENPFTFKPQFQIWFSTNHKPDIRSTDHGIWRRVQLLEFGVRFWQESKGETGPDHLKAIDNLEDLLLEELPGILQWAIMGCLEWQNKGLNPPKSVIESTSTYRKEQDVMGEFIQEYCVTGEFVDVRDSARNLYDKYARFCEEIGERAMKQKSFGMALKERGFLQTRQAGTGISMWRGIAVRI